MATTIATLSVAITGNPKGLTKAYGRALRSTKKFTAGMAQAAKRIAQIGIVAGGVAAVGLGLLMKRTFANIDATAKFADRIGITTEALTGLRHAAELTGGGKAIDLGLQRMTRRLAEAALGTGEAQDAIKELGLDAEKLGALAPDQQFMRVADAMQAVESQGQRVRLAFKLFDTEGVALVNTLAGGSKAIRRMMADADRLGLTFSRVDAAKIEEANDAFTRLGGLLEGAAGTLAIRIAPFVETIVTRFVDWAAEGDKVGGAMDRIFDEIKTGMLTAIQFTQDLAHGFARIGLVAIDAGKVVVDAFFKPMFFRMNELIDMFNRLTNAVKSQKLTAKDSRLLGRAGDEAIGLGGLSAIPKIPVKDTIGSMQRALDDAAWQAILFKDTIESTNWAGAALTELDLITSQAQKRAQEIADDRKRRGGIGEQVKAAQQETLLKKLAIEAKSIFDATRTPLQKYEIRLLRLSLLLDKQVISQKTYDEAVLHATAALGKATKAITAGAVERGSAAAASARARAANRPAQEIAKRQLTEVQKTNTILTRIDDGIRQIGVQPSIVSIGR